MRSRYQASPGLAIFGVPENYGFSKVVGHVSLWALTRTLQEDKSVWLLFQCCKLLAVNRLKANQAKNITGAISFAATVPWSSSRGVKAIQETLSGIGHDIRLYRVRIWLLLVGNYFAFITKVMASLNFFLHSICAYLATFRLKISCSFSIK